MRADPTAATTPWCSAWTPAAASRFSGIGLHSGTAATLTLEPAAAGTGLVFCRVDLPGAPEIPALAGSVVDTRLCTELAAEGARVRTVEHLLAALHGMGISDARLLLDGPEVPLLDGSSLPYVEALLATGVRVLDAERPTIALGQGGVVEGEKAITTLAGSGRWISYVVDYGHPLAGPRIFQGELTPATFARAIAPARTFGFARDIEALRQAGLARGGSADNAVVIGDAGYSSPLRFDDEFVRHKVLDLIGDLALLGAFWHGHVIAIKAGHALHNQLARQILGEPARREAALAGAQETR